VDRIAQQPDRTGQHRDQQLGQARQAQPGRADRDRAVGLPPLIRVITRMRKRESHARITLPQSLVHDAKDKSG
jgi:hypothetical protein